MKSKLNYLIAAIAVAAVAAAVVLGIAAPFGEPPAAAETTSTPVISEPEQTEKAELSPEPEEESDQTENPAPELEPSPEPTAQPSPEPLPDEPEPSVSAAPTSPAVSSAQLESYFDNTVFIGDSILEGVRLYVAKNRAQEPTLGNAQFLTSTVGVSVANLLNGEKDGPYYRYNGTNQYLLQILPQMECKRIFVQLGLNDMAAVDPVVETSVEQYSRLIDLLQMTVPEAEIIVITNPPKVASAWLPDYTPNRSFSNALISEFVNALTQMCETRGIPYVDAHAALRNADGVLPDDYCSDGFVHLNSTGAKEIVAELYRFAAERIA